jgi:hypothetical protein
MVLWIALCLIIEFDGVFLQRRRSHTVMIMYRQLLGSFLRAILQLS